MAAGIRRATDAGGGDVVLMEATLRLIGRRGLDSVTHRAVAGEAGVSLGAVTHYFASRDDLIDRALRFAVTREVARLRDLVLGLQRKALNAPRPSRQRPTQGQALLWRVGKPARSRAIPG